MKNIFIFTGWIWENICMNIFILICISTPWRKSFSKLLILVNLTDWPYRELILCGTISLRINNWAHWSRADVKSLCDQTLMGLPTPHEYHTAIWERKAPKPWAPTDTTAAMSWQVAQGSFSGRKGGGLPNLGKASWVKSSPGRLQILVHGLRVGEGGQDNPRDNSRFPPLYFFLSSCPDSPPIRTATWPFLSQIPLPSHPSNELFES